MDNQDRELQGEQMETAVITCVNCGKALDEFTGLSASADWYGDTRFVHYCRDCMEGYYEELAGRTTAHLALFYCCIAFNVPLVFSDIPSLDDPGAPWLAYLDNLRRSGRLCDAEGEPATFTDGTTDILKLFGGDLSGGEFAKAIRLESCSADKLPGTKNQRKNWGTLDGFSSEQYKELDRLYEIQSKPYLASGIDGELEYNLREICKALLKYSDFLSRGKSNDAKSMMSIVETIKSSNLMRKKDEKPIEDMRIDTLIDKLEKGGFLKKGQLLNPTELLEKIQGLRPHYPHSFDAVDQALLCVNNTMRLNAGMGESAELPESLRFIPMEGEFEAEAPEWERDVKEKLGMLPIDVPKPPGKNGD